jgi:hypothetical protein
MQQINALKTFPSGTPIDAVQAKISKAYERKDIPNGTYGPTSVQSAVIEDAGGNKMKIKVWGHPDIAKLEGQEVVIHAGKGGKGLVVKHETYTLSKGPKAGQTVTHVLVEAGRTSQFQTVAVFHQSNPQAASPAVGGGSVGAPAPATSQVIGHAGNPIHGATAGEATKLAMELLIATGQAADMASEGTLENTLVKIGVQIARAHLRIEKGDEVRGAVVQSPAKAVSGPAGSSEAPNPGDDSGIPF